MRRPNQEVTVVAATRTGQEKRLAARLLVHMVPSALFGMVFALVVPRLRTNGTVALAGTLLSFAFFGPGARRGEPVLASIALAAPAAARRGAWSTGR